MQRLKIGFCFLAMTFMLGSCATTGGQYPETKRQAVLDMRDQVLAQLYEEHPQARTEIESAPGYAVFSNTSVYLIYGGFGWGYGVVTDNKTGKNTFMKMGKTAVGLGFGATEFRAIFIFDKRSVMQQFINSGWEFGGQADAAF
ncbi:MAG TPA: hypothetical protein VK460_05755, partial [Burkholderiales bacterium]|nr:hypothetical protein [Burkholderiales bacterium]